MKCNACNSTMDYFIVNQTHCWICQECPIISFEYYTKENLQDLMTIMSRRNFDDFKQG
jgi:hypothetical protein